MQPTEPNSNVVAMHAGARSARKVPRPLLVRLGDAGHLTLAPAEREDRLAAAGLAMFGLARAEAMEADGTYVAIGHGDMLRSDGRPWRITRAPLRASA